VGVFVNVGVLVAVNVGVNVGVLVAVNVGVKVGVNVGVGVLVGQLTKLPSTPVVYSRKPFPKSATPVNFPATHPAVV
jgi:hypothetical protein